MWFSVVCTLIDNDIRHHSGQNLLWTHIRFVNFKVYYIVWSNQPS